MRRPPTPSPRPTGIVNTEPDSARPCRRGCAPRDASRCASARRSPRRCAPASSASRSRPGRATPTTCRPVIALRPEPVEEPPSAVDAIETVLDMLRPLLEDRRDRQVGHDLKFDAIMLARHGVTLHGLDTDTMLASYLIDATRAEHQLEDLALEHVSYKALKDEDVCGRGAKAISLADVPVEAILDLRRASAPTSSASSRRSSASCSRRSSSPTSTSELERPLIPVLVRDRARRHPHRRPGARLAVAAPRAGDGAAHDGDPRGWPAANSTSTRRSSSPKCCSTRCSCRC